MADVHKVGDFTVNDGKGLFDNLGIIDTLIEDCNELPKDLMNGQNVRFCKRIVHMVQKLANLKTGIEADMNDLKEQIKDLNKQNEELANQCMPVERE